METEEYHDTNEMKVLRDFVREFSPLLSETVEDLTYNELFSLVGDIYRNWRV